MKEIRILLRFDDICPTMDFAQFDRAWKLMKEYDLKPLLGVIPDCKDPQLHIEHTKEHADFWEWLRGLQNDGYAIAMHGFEHVYDMAARGIVNNGCKSEFAGHSYEVQYEKIRKGKEILKSHGIETDIFFAPAHSYDKLTIRALYENGFHYMSDGKSNKAVWKKGILCIPCRAFGCPRMKRKGNYTAVFHANEWTRKDKSNGYDQLAHLCKMYHGKIVGFSEFVAGYAIGNYYIQSVDEWMYVQFERKLLPFLSNMKKRVLKGGGKNGIGEIG